MDIDWQKLKELNLKSAHLVIKEMGLDGLLLTAYDNMRYIYCREMYIELDWFTGQYAVIIPDGGDPVDLAVKAWEDYPYIPAPLIAGRWAEKFVDGLKNLKLAKGKIGVDSWMTFPTFFELKKRAPKVTFIPALQQFLEARAVKNEIEVELLRESANVIDVGLRAGLESLRLGIREYEVYAKMHGAMIEAGAEYLPASRLIGSGPSEDLKALTKGQNRKLQNGDAVTFDIHCHKNGYAGDGARSYTVGKARKEIKETSKVLYEAQMSGINAIKPAVKASEVDAATRKPILEAGYPDYHHSTGHGIGVTIMELPWIAKSKEAGNMDTVLKPRMVVCLEPDIWHENWKLEDMILVTESGHERLTKAPYFEDLEK